LENFLHTYGYLAIVVGTFLEGETILIIAGFLAHRGYLSLSLVILAAFAGSLAGDQLFFVIGRIRGKPFIERRESWRPKAERVREMLGRFETLVMVGFRFVYGMRTVTPFVLGVSDVRAAKFVFLNAVGAAAWAAAVATGGYVFGAALEAVLADVKRYELAVVAAAAVIGASAGVIHYIRRRRSSPQGR
jgi:membrane protein DedA with SNARE-associated domain